MAERYAKIFDLPAAFVHKARITGEEVKVQRIVGDVCDKEVVVVDDMISTGETIAKARAAANTFMPEARGRCGSSRALKTCMRSRRATSW